MPLSWDPECSWTPTLKISLSYENKLNCILIFIQCEQGYKTHCCYFHFPQMRSLLAAWASTLLQLKMGQVSLKPGADMEKASHNHTAGSDSVRPPKAQLHNWDFASLHQIPLWKKQKPLGWHNSHLGGSSWEANLESAALLQDMCLPVS